MKLHLGCGKRFIEGFVHIDLQNYDFIDHQSSVDDLSFIEDNSVDLIYASHVLEHLGRHSYRDILIEWNRVLKVGGVLRVSVPDFDAVVDYYNTDGDISKVLGFLVGGQRNYYDFHTMVFNEKILSEVLYSVGFSKVEKYDWRNTEHSHIDDYSQAYLPHMDKDNGMLMSLNIEATK